MKNEKTRELTFMALYVALYIVFWYLGKLVPFLQMPQGGSIELQFAVLFVASFHLGWKKGIAVSMLSWLAELILGGANWYLNPMQYLLDYILPLAAAGAADLFAKGKNRYILGVVIAMILKYASTVLSGVYFWPPENGVAGSGAAWVYSLSYNLWYNLATCVVCVILAPILLKHLKRMKLIS